MLPKMGIKQKKQRMQRIIVLFFAYNILTACSGEAALPTTSFVNLQVVGTDQTVISYTGTTETDPFFTAQFYAASIAYPGMNIFFNKGWKGSDANTDQYLRLSFIPTGSSNGVTYDDASSNVGAFYEDVNGSYVVTSSSYTPITVTISNYGDVGKTIDGTFDVTLCLLDKANADLNTCSDALNRVHLVGSFGVIREEDGNG